MANHSFVGHNGINLRVVKASHRLGIEFFECAAIPLSPPENGDPTQTRLSTL
jgi:hypothetical protein